MKVQTLAYTSCITILLLCCQLHALFAQYNRYKWQIGTGIGLMSYHGDLSYKWIDPNQELIDLLGTNPWAYSLTMGRQLTATQTLIIEGGTGHFIANDRTIDWRGNPRTDNPNYLRALNVRTQMNWWTIGWQWQLRRRQAAAARLVPIYTMGIGMTHFTPKADLYYPSDDGQQLPYYYWDDGTIRDQPQSSGTGILIAQDGIFETSLRPLQTEGANYKPYTFHLRTGLGALLRLSPRLHLTLQANLYWTATDYLDDLSGQFPQAYESETQQYASNPAGIEGLWRGHPNGKNDRYLTLFSSLYVHFGRKAQSFKMPPLMMGALSLVEPPTTQYSSGDSLAQTATTQSTPTTIAPTDNRAAKNDRSAHSAMPKPNTTIYTSALPDSSYTKKTDTSATPPAHTTSAHANTDMLKAQIAITAQQLMQAQLQYNALHKKSPERKQLKQRINQLKKRLAALKKLDKQINAAQ